MSYQFWLFFAVWKTLKIESIRRHLSGRTPHSSKTNFLFVMKLSKVGFLFPEPFAGLLCFSLPLHTDLDGPIVTKKSLLCQNGLQLNKKCLELIV